MDKIVEMLTFLLDKNIRVKNAISVFLGLFFTIIVYFSSKSEAWFLEISQFGDTGVALVLGITFLMSFLSVWLFCSCIIWLKERIVSLLAMRRKAQRENEILRKNLKTLSEWQYDFVLRFVRERRHHIPSYEIGGYKAVWGAEMDILIMKGIVQRHSGIYEISSKYYDFIEQCLSEEFLYDHNAGEPS